MWLTAFARALVRRPFIAPRVLGFLPAFAFAMAFWFSLPSPLFDPVYSTVIMDREGRLLSASIAADGQWRFPADTQIPARFVTALLTWEDKRFFRHPGIDPFAIVRAVSSNIRGNKVVSGASTITMQVIRLSRPGAPRTVPEKLFEMLLALRLETGATKSQILRYFASMAPFGGNVVGFEAASWRYFGREPETLTWAECALLAVLPNSPGLVHPGKNRETLLAKRDTLLEMLFHQGAIDSDTLEQARREPLPSQPYPLPQHAPHLLSRIREESSKSLSAGNGSPGRKAEARVRTTLDFSLQVRVNQIVLRASELWKESGVENGAVMVEDVATGDVLAYAGNVPPSSERDSGTYVDIITSRRSTGSLLKPFLYAAMLDAGETLPDQLVSDVPTRIGGFVPENNTGGYGGAVPASAALAHSLNVPAVRMLRAFGVQRFTDILKGLGLTTLIRPASQYGLTLILGGAEGTLWELIGLYAGLARSALRLPEIRQEGRSAFFPPHYMQQSAGSGRSGPTVANAPRVELSAGASWLTLKALLEVERPGEEGAWRDYIGSRKIAWKTGTSQGFRDAWAIGVTPRYAVGVWVGNASGVGKPDLRGSALAAPVLFDVFGLLPETGWFAAPESDLARVTVCAKSGFRAGPDCAEVKDILAPPSAFQAGVCRYCRIVHLDSTGRYRATTLTDPMGSLRAVPWFVLPPAMEWFYERSHSDYKPLPPWKPGSQVEEESSASLGLIFPDQGERVYVPVDLDGTPEKTVFRAAHRNPRAAIFWHLDGEYLGETTEIHDMEARPGPGKHILTLVDERGEECVRTFWCLSRK
jgi:penicillin-binding protein 1C